MVPSLISRTSQHLFPIILLLLFTNVYSQAVPSPLTSPCPVVLPTARIVGGTLIQSPYMVLFRSRLSECSGTLITSTKVLTARHCRIDSSTTAFVSSTTGFDGSQIPVQFTDSHPTDDVAVVTLAEPALVPPVRILTNPDIPTPWSFVRAQGFGLQSFYPFPSDSQLRFVDVPVISSELCETLLRDATNIDDVPLSADPAFPDRFVCSGYLESASCTFCSGDSGGPLLAYLDDNPVVVGVISRGIRCTLPDRPGLSVRVASVIPWLDELGVPYNGVSELSETFVDDQGSSGNRSVSDAGSEPVGETASVGLSGGAIAGIAVGGVIAMLVAVLAILLGVRASRKRDDPGLDGGEGGAQMYDAGATLMPPSEPVPPANDAGPVPPIQPYPSAPPSHPGQPVPPSQPAQPVPLSQLHEPGEAVTDPSATKDTATPMAMTQADSPPLEAATRDVDIAQP